MPNDNPYTYEEKIDIRNGIVNQMKSFANESFIIPLECSSKKIISLFDYDEIINDYAPSFRNQQYRNDICLGFEVSDAQLKELEMFTDCLKCQIKHCTCDELHNELSIFVLKDLNWHVVQEKAREILTLFNYLEDIPRVRILQNKLDSIEYCNQELQKFLNTIGHISNDYFQKLLDSYDFKYIANPIQVCFINIYYLFSIKAEIILNYPDKFHLTGQSFVLMKELLEKMDNFYHNVMQHQLTTQKVLGNPEWIEIQKMTEKVLEEFKK